MSKCVPQKWAPKVYKGVPNILQVEPNVFFARYSVVTVVCVPYLVQIGAVQVDVTSSASSYFCTICTMHSFVLYATSPAIQCYVKCYVQHVHCVVK